MITKSGFRSLLEGVGNDATRFERHMLHMMGLCDEQGRRYTKGLGDRTLKDPKGGPRIKPDEITMRGLAESLLGDSPDQKAKLLSHVAQRRLLLESSASTPELRQLLEDNGAGAVMPSAFANISAFVGVATGLLEVGVLEAYENPEFIADTLAPAQPSKQFEGRKEIGASRIGDQAEERLPGMPTKRVQFGERWITQPRTVENAASCELLQEDLFLDITGGQVSERGNEVGEWVAYRKELRVIDSFIGVTNTYNYKGTTYNTYITGGYYDNDIASNALDQIDNVKAAEIKFRDMTDPETGTKIRVTPDTLLVQQEYLYNAMLLFGGDQTQVRSAPGATTGEQYFRVGPNPIKGKYAILTSPLVQQRLTDSTGLNLSATNAGKYWWLFQKGPKTHVYVQNWPMRTQTAAPNNVDSIDRGIVLFIKADERGIPMWKDPRRSVRNKN